jgi:hypothetical protein
MYNSTVCHNPECVAVQEQFIMAYGGLRGAVGYSLVLSIDKHKAGPQGRISNQHVVMFSN